MIALDPTHTDESGVSAMALAAKCEDGQRCDLVLQKLHKLGLHGDFSAACEVASKELTKGRGPSRGVRDVALMTKLAQAVFWGCPKDYFAALQLASICEAAVLVHG